MSRKISQEEAVQKYSISTLKMIGQYIDSHTSVEYECICGNIKKIRPSHVGIHNTKSCGCLKKTDLNQDEAAKKYSTNQLKMIGKFINCNTPVEYMCYCGKIFKTRPSFVIDKHSQSCGCYNIEQIKKYNTTKYNTVLNQEQQQIFDGLLISDGCIGFGGRNINPVLRISSITPSFINDIKNSLPFIWQKDYIRKASTDIINNRLINRKQQFSLSSTADKSLFDEYNRWYKYNQNLNKFIKIIPQNLEISPLLLKYWFYGDGTSSWLKNSTKRSCIRLCTNGFTYEECLSLQEKLQNIGIDFYIYKSNAKTTKQNQNRGYLLGISKTSTVIDFFNYIGNCDINGFQYKWKIPNLK